MVLCIWHMGEDSNLHLSVLETDDFPINLPIYGTGRWV